MLCGVGHQTVPAVVVAREGWDQVARDLWTAKRTGTQSLGGRLSPATVSGHLCRACAVAVTHARAIGPTALERALVVAIAPEGVGKLGWGHLAVDGSLRRPLQQSGRAAQLRPDGEEDEQDDEPPCSRLPLTGGLGRPNHPSLPSRMDRRSDRMTDVDYRRSHGPHSGATSHPTAKSAST